MPITRRRPKRPAAPSDKPTAKNPLSRRCKNCPKMFTATRDQHYFCSAKCRKEFHDADNSAYGHVKHLFERQLQAHLKEFAELKARVEALEPPGWR